MEPEQLKPNRFHRAHRFPKPRVHGIPRGAHLGVRFAGSLPTGGVERLRQFVVPRSQRLRIGLQTL